MEIHEYKSRFRKQKPDYLAVLVDILILATFFGFVYVLLIAIYG